MGAFCPCEPYHVPAPVGEFFREDAIYRAIIPVQFLCPLDRVAIASNRSLPEVVEEAVTEYCQKRGIDPALFEA